MAELKKYRVWCVTEEAYVFTGYQSSAPTECPNDPEHEVDSDQTIAAFTKQTSAPTKDDDSAHGYLVDHIWVDQESNQVWICADDTPGAAVWRLAGGTSDLAGGNHHIHVGEGTPSEAWKLLTTFIYQGTSIWGGLSNVLVLARANNGTGTLRVFDPVNNNVIVEKGTISNEDYAVFSLGTLDNLPESAVGLELQGKKVDVMEIVLVF